MESTSQILHEPLNEDSVLDELNTLWTKSLDIVVELGCLQDFNEVVPGAFNPRRIIEYMREMHRLNAFAINDQPDLLETVFYMYIGEQDNRACQLKFSNNMSFRDDILIICYIHEIINISMLSNQSYKEMNIINVLLKLITKKYRLNDSNMAMNWNIRNITLSDISLSFPSISLDMFNNNFGGIFQYIIPMFPNMDLPNIMYVRPSTMIYRILPKLSNPPIAILIAISLKIDNCFCSTTEQVPLAAVFSIALANYNSTYFPESLKIFLCRRWNIVTMVDGNYQFNSSFMLYYNQAKDLIRELREPERSKDISGFEDILSKL